ncbi:MAG: General secretory pathway protein E [candidate division TM6 bacterium GW2011_GWF2_38_10]|nr:MAG: General secretory pathway protein E [candidate division TM6 bacterium GW2011_GWF2_38_10]
METNVYYHLKSPALKKQEQSINDPIIDIVDTLCYNAIVLKASDIHLQPSIVDVHIRYRIDGVLCTQNIIKKDDYTYIISRLKILANLDIAQTRLPQDGKIKVKILDTSPCEPEHTIDIRVSTFPSINGEKMVLRILDKTQHLKTLSEIGLTTHQEELLSTLILQDNGFFLLTGPTGSGKSTTLYALLSNLNHHENNIVTMEDPVEYDISGIMQSQVNNQAGFTFANGLRSLLRQDPDVILIGEIRDKETVQIAVEAALTGHLVLSTLHTNNACGAITRLLDMGIEPFLINATLTGIMAQRLVRKLCDHCKQAYTPEEHEHATIKKYGKLSSTLYKATGCPECRQTGYSGRIGIFELLILNDTIQQLILQKSSQPIIQHQALQDGMLSLAQDGLEKLNAGIISYTDYLCFIK